jgi:NADH-ubiquinone oxidoreductase chain 6
MNNLLLIKENILNGYNTEILFFISLLAIFSGIFVIISKNPIVSVLFLIGLFASISSYLIILGLSFIGLSYLIVYIGAVSILFLFILMLINIRISEIQNLTSNSIILSTLTAIFFTFSFFQILPYNIAIINNYRTYINNILYNVYSSQNSYSNLENNDLFFITGKI